MLWPEISVWPDTANECTVLPAPSDAQAVEPSGEKARPV
jgi:hypothetical protein